MELFKTQDYYIFQQSEHSLWCSRKTGSLEPRSAWDLTAADDPVCLGLVHGIIGKHGRFPDADPQLLVIESCSLVGYVWNQKPIYKINKIGLLSLGQGEPDITTHPCPKHSHSVAFNQKPDEYSPKPVSRQQEALAKTWSSIKSASKSLKTSTVQAAHRMGIESRDGSGAERGARKLMDEVEKMFSQSDSFYFSPEVDLTTSIQASGENYVNPSSWKTADERFFWNQYLLRELIDLKDPRADAWIVPVLHGYVHIDTVPVELDDGGVGLAEWQHKSLTLFLVSRRSRHRAGTRYKRRGVDENGYVANYVETEQCLLFQGHVLSFVQLRGSVPVFWSQPGFKYRPPPQIDRGVEETRQAFQRHFERELSIYGKQCIVSLVEQGGKEKVIGDAFTDNIIHLSEPRLIYATFDFHEQCRGLRFENLGRLVSGLEDVLQEMRYTWIDSHGVIHMQQCTFRVNCMDCLDRTNVCQTAFAKYVLEVQLNKLGILPPEGSFWPALKSAFNVMWANNGDVLSRQYAGTNALKGDFTRTGERRLAGMMKDGMNSANRYYLNRFKDTVKQTAIDLMSGQLQPDEAMNVLYGQQQMMDRDEDEEGAVLATADRVRQVIDDCRKMFVGVDEIVVGSWGLVDAHPSTGDPTQIDMDVIVLLTRYHLYVVSYDDDDDQVRECKKYPLPDLVKLEVGSEASGKTGGVGNFLKSPSKRMSNESSSSSNSPAGGSNAGTAGGFVMRITLGEGFGGPLQFRSTRLRFFNNMAVPICKTEEMNESLKAIAENIHVTMEISGLTIPYVVGTLEKFPKATAKIEMPILGFPRNTSEGQLSVFKQAGNKALSSVTSHLSRLKPNSLSRNSPGRSPNQQQAQDHQEAPSSLATGPGEPSSQMESTSNAPALLPSSYSIHVLDDLPSGLVKDCLHSSEAGVLFLVSREPVRSARVQLADQLPVMILAGKSPVRSSKILSRCVSAGQFDRHYLPSSAQQAINGADGLSRKLTRTPEIVLVEADGQTEENGGTSLLRTKPFARSTECVEPATAADLNEAVRGAGSYLSLSSTGSGGGLPRASSETSIGSNQSAPSSDMKSSKSTDQSGGFLNMSAFRIPAPQGRFSLAGKSGSPLGLLAKGVQNLGQLDPRRILDKSTLAGSNKPNISSNNEEMAKIQQLCSTRIIRL